MSKELKKYSVKGTVTSENKKRFDLKGFFIIEEAEVAPDYIMSIISNGENYFKLSYKITESSIWYDTDKKDDSENIFSEGCGNINLEYQKKKSYWDNNNKWHVGSIDDSMTENDVIFYENGSELDLIKYDRLPQMMNLNNGFISGKTHPIFFPINLKLTQVINPT